jgi:hypothetical protein
MAGAAAAVVDRGDEHVADPEVKDDDAPGGGAADTKPGPADETVETEEERTEREAAEAKAAEDADKAKRIRIPKSRFDEAVNREREKTRRAEEENEQLRQELAKREVSQDVKVIQNRIDELEEQIEGFRADGKKTELAAARREIRELQDVLLEQKVNVRALQAKEMAKIELRYDTYVEQIEKDHPELNPDDDAYDAELAAELKEAKDGYVALGYTPYDALRKVMTRMFRQQPAAASAPAPKNEDRTVAARTKAAEAARRQPPSLRDAGFDSDKAGGSAGDAKNIMKMDQKDFAKLTDDQKRVMRGDDV